MSRSGVRYITEEFIKISAHEERLEKIKKLNLDCGKEDKQIRYIEHLENLVNLNILSLRFHTIEKIEKFDKLVNLRELYLSENRISKLDGLENLMHLKILDVRGNKINSVPHWFTRRCKYLTKINFSNNLFESVEEVSKLWTLKDLIDLDISENPVSLVAHCRSYIIMRLKFLQKLDNREVLVDERKNATDLLEENELDRLSSRIVENEKQIEEMKTHQLQLQKDHSHQESYQKELHNKQKSNIEKIKQLEEKLESKDMMLKKKSEDLFRACQKYYELEQDIAFIKIDAKFDLLSNNIGSLDEPDNLSDHSQISSTGDHAYMGKGQFITKKEAEMLMERKRVKHSQIQNGETGHEGRNSGRKIKEDFVDSLNERVKEKLEELNKINKEISEKNIIVSKLNSEFDHQETIQDTYSSSKPMMNGAIKPDRPRSALAFTNRLSPLRTLLNRPRRISDTDLTARQNSQPSFVDQFLEKVENLTEMQKEAEELRRQMESTEKESNRQQKDIAYLRDQLENLKIADPNLAHRIEDEVKEKEQHVDENLKLYNSLSKRLDQLSLAIEESMNDIREIELKLLEDNQYFTDNMRQSVNSALSKLTQSIPNKSHQDYKNILNNYHEIERENKKLNLKIKQQQKDMDLLQAQNDGMSSARRSARSIDDEVEILRKELNQLRQDAMAAKDDLESEIEMEKVLNDELQKQIEDMKQNENQLTDELETMQEKQRRIMDKIKADQFLTQESLQQQLMNFQDDLLHRIKSAATDNQIENLEKSKNPIDKALLNLIQSVKQTEEDNDNNVINPEIANINEELQKIKIELDKMNRKISTDSHYNPVQSTYDQKNESNSHSNRSKPDSIRKMLSKTSQIYNNDMRDIKSAIKHLYDKLSQGSKIKTKQSAPTKHTKVVKLFPKMISDTWNESTTSEDTRPVIKSRAQSHDRISKKSKSISSPTKKWTSLQQGISSDEQAMFDALQDELQDLMKHIDIAEKSNALRIEEAMNHINNIERELQDKNEDEVLSDRTEFLDRTKENLSEHLKETMYQVEKCQDDIKKLYERLGHNIKISKIQPEKNKYGTELEKMEFILQSQKSEIERLNNLLEKLCMHDKSNSTQFVQASSVNTPTQSNGHFFPSGFPPNHQNSHSTPMLNGEIYSLNFNSPMKNAGSLFCNVPEHHYLEDYFQMNGTGKSSWKLKRKFKSDSEKLMNTLETLQDDINKKNEELDNVEIQISKQTNEIGRLNYQIDQLNFTKQDLLNNISCLRQETEHVTRETIATTSESLGHMRARKSILTEELNKIESNVRDKQDELFRTEKELKHCRNDLCQVQEQTSETLRRHDEARLNHRKVVIECEELEKRSKEASYELARALNDLNAVQNEISGLNSNKKNLEDVLTKIQSIINQKDQDFQKLNEEINKATMHLNTLQSNLNMTMEQNREKLHMLSEGDQLLSDTRSELNRLKNEIVINQEQFQKMESELGERGTSLEIVNGEIERSRQVHHRIIQEHQNEQIRLKRELSDLKFDLEGLKDEKCDLTNINENLKMKNMQLKDNADKQEQMVMVKQSELDKMNWQTQHIDNMLKMKQGQLDKILSEYQNKIMELEKMEEEIHQQQIESKKLDTDLKRKAIEIDKIRQTVAIENESIHRLQFDKENLDSNIVNLTKEKNLIQNERKELEANVKMLRRQESQTHESLVALEGKVSQARTELEKMYSEKCSETIKRDELKAQSNSLSKQLHESRCELQTIKERVNMIESQCDERTTEVRKKMQLQASLNMEIRKLQDQIRLASMSFDEVNNQEQQKKEKLFGLDNDITRKCDEIKNLEKKINDLQTHASKEDFKLEKILKNSSSELAQLKSEISEKLENLEATGNRLHQVKKDAAIKEFTEQKIFELEDIIRQQENNIDHFQQENRKLSNHLSIISRDFNLLKQNHQLDIENKEKEIARLKKRAAKEIFQLEKLAEEQCSRSHSLTDDLNQARRDYMLLRNRCLAQEHFIEQQNLFKEYMQPNAFKSSPSWETNSKIEGQDLPVGVETAILAEHRRHLQNQLNLLKENIVSATQASQNGIANHNFNGFINNKTIDNNLKWNTGSSGLGSTLDHTGNSSDTFLENDRIKKALHTQFNEEVEKINNENTRCEIMCRQLRNEVDNLKSSLPSEKSPSTLSE